MLDGKNLVLAVILAAADKGRAFQERAQPIKKCHHISAATCSRDDEKAMGAEK